MRTKFFNHWGMLTTGALLVALSVVACINNIPGDDTDGDDKEQQGDVDVNLIAEIEQNFTRMKGNSFEKGDKLGLFAITSNGSMETSRYADNLLVVYQSNGSLQFEEPLFYPNDDVSVDFYAYYPYQEEGIPEGSSLLPVKVQTDQSDDEAFQACDFFAASLKGIYATNEPQLLTFKHRMAKIKVELKASEGLSIKELLSLDPRVVATNFYTEGMYDLTKDNFTKLSAVSDIVANGTWKEDGNVLVGKEIIVIPQDVGSFERGLQLEIGNRIITCPLTEETLQCGTDFTISLPITQELGVDGIIIDVEDWQDGGRQEGTATDEINAIHTAVFSFNGSNGYKVSYENKDVAEVWREYLCTGAGVGVQAIVAYPVKDGKCDLSNGLLLEEIGSTASTCGGKLSWKADNSGYTYTKGNLPPIKTFYVNSDFSLSVEKPSNPLRVKVGYCSLIDYRDDTPTSYPLAKIGTQFWIARDLCAKSFADGTKLDAAASISPNNNSHYFKVDGKSLYFYNGETLMNKEIAPKGFRLPTDEDWKQLQTYLHGDVTVLKKGDWKPVLDETKKVTAATDLTGFRGLPNGMWTNSHDFYGQTAAYWSWDNATGKPAEKLIMLFGEESDFVTNIYSYYDRTKESGYNIYKGASVRCLKE